MIVFDGVATRRAPLALSSVSLAWDAGMHAVVGAREDGGPLLLALVAGLARPRAGSVLVLGAPPADAAVRRQVALVPLEPSLPGAMRTREVLALAAAIGANRPATAAFASPCSASKIRSTARSGPSRAPRRAPSRWPRR